MPKLLITGANGQLGSEINVLAGDYPQFDFIFTDVDTLNITSLKEVLCFVEANPIDFIINCAAYTAVDKAEDDRDTAFLINTIAVDFLIEAAEKTGAFLVHVSTDYVFDGSRNVPYDEEDPTFPASVYGESKNEGEKLILYSGIDALIVRTSWLYSTFGNNFVKTMLRLGNEKDSINVVFDQVGSPTYARDLAKAILDLIPKIDRTHKGIQEIYHYTNEGVCSWYDLTCEIFRQKKIQCKVNPVLSNQFPSKVKRPNYSVLNKSKIKKKFAVDIPHWTDSLKEMLSRLE